MYHVEWHSFFRVNFVNVDMYVPENFIELLRDEIFQSRFIDEEHKVGKINDIAKRYLVLWEKVRLNVTVFFLHLTLLNLISAVSYNQKLVTDTTLYEKWSSIIIDHIGAEYCKTSWAVSIKRLALNEIAQKYYLMNTVLAARYDDDEQWMFDLFY